MITAFLIFSKKINYMNWNEYAQKIDAKFKEELKTFIGGEKIFKEIEKEEINEKIKAHKEIRKSYGASSHFNLEKLNIEFSFENIDFGKNRIIRKSYLSRIGKTNEAQYNIEGEKLTPLKNILASSELKYLLQYSKSEFIVFKNSIFFKAQSIGEMNEDLEKIFNSIQLLKSEISKNLSA